MADVSEIDNNDKTPLLKPKRMRPPPSEKQKENFKLLQQRRAESISKRKEEKIFEAQKALLQKEGKLPTIAKTPEPQAIQFEIEEEEEEVKAISKPLAKKKQVKEKVEKVIVPAPPIKKTIARKSRAPTIVEDDSEDEDEDDSDSEEEIIVIKRSKNKKKSNKPLKRVISSDDEETYESVANKHSGTNQNEGHNIYGGFFC